MAHYSKRVKCYKRHINVTDDMLSFCVILWREKMEFQEDLIRVESFLQFVQVTSSYGNLYALDFHKLTGKV